MLIIGEKLNSSIPKTLEAMKAGDEGYLSELIERQAQCGADFLDINTALTGDKELSNMLWATKLAATKSDCGIMLDSPDPEIILKALAAVSGREIIVNSVNAEARYDELLAAVAKSGTSVVCMPIKDRKIPETADGRLNAAGEIIEKLRSFGIPDGKIYIDVLVEAIATGEEGAMPALDTIKAVKGAFPKVKTICGLSNVSFGLPERGRLNSFFLAMALLSGIDAAICDPTSERLRDALSASQALLGKDEYCLEYIGNARSHAK